MSGLYLYCQNPDCGSYLGSLGGNNCQNCGWVAVSSEGDGGDPLATQQTQEGE